jgi:hypothetical protein
MGVNTTDLGQRQLLGAGQVTVAGSAITGVWRTGNVVPARTGAGVFTLTCGPGTAAAEVMATISQATAGSAPTVTIANTGGVAVVTISTFAVDGTTATDKAFSYEVWGAVPGTFVALP